MLTSLMMEASLHQSHLPTHHNVTGIRIWFKNQSPTIVHEGSEPYFTTVKQTRFLRCPVVNGTDERAWDNKKKAL